MVMHCPEGTCRFTVEYSGGKHVFKNSNNTKLVASSYVTAAVLCLLTYSKLVCYVISIYLAVPSCSERLHMFQNTSDDGGYFNEQQNISVMNSMMAAADFCQYIT